MCMNILHFEDNCNVFGAERKKECVIAVNNVQKYRVRHRFNMGIWIENNTITPSFVRVKSGLRSTNMKLIGKKKHFQEGKTITLQLCQ